MRKTLLLLCLFTLISCKTTKKSNSELYVSGYISEDFNDPSNLFLGSKNDSVFILDFEGYVYNKHKLPKSKKDTIIKDDEKVVLLKTEEFAKYEIFKNNKLNFEGYFFKFKEEKNKSANDFLKTVKDKTFVTEIQKTSSSPNTDLEIYKYLKFNDDGNVSITYNYYYDKELIHSEIETHQFRNGQINESLFLQILNSDKYPNRIYEIIKLKNNEFTLVHYAETKTIYEDYKKIEPSVIKSKPYQICNDRRPKEYFNYDPDLRHQKGNKYLLKTLSENAPLTKGNGYITIHFTINCNYDIGRFGLEQMNMNYESTTFDTALIKHLITKISEIKDWNSNKEKNNGYDIHYFLMFKIENGKIIDLCP